MKKCRRVPSLIKDFDEKSKKCLWLITKNCQKFRNLSHCPRPIQTLNAENGRLFKTVYLTGEYQDNDMKNFLNIILGKMRLKKGPAKGFEILIFSLKFLQGHF